MKQSIRDVLKPFLSSSSPEQAVLNTQLKTSFESLSNNNYGWNYFNFLINGNTGWQQNIHESMRYHPYNIVALCDKLGIIFYDDLLSWIEAMSLIDTDSLIDIHSPSIQIPISDEYKISYSSIKKIIKDNCKFKYTHDWGRQFDAYYHAIPEESFDEIRQQCPIDRVEYQSEKRDCEDFAFMTKSWLRLQGYGNLSLGIVSVDCTEIVESGYPHSFNHAINLVLLQRKSGERYLKYWEPQNDQVWNVNDPMQWGLKKYNLEIYYYQV